MAKKKEYLGIKIIGGVLVLYLLSWGAIEYFYEKSEEAGQFGDQFGAVNALFSALALAGVIYTLIQQQQEMKAQRREFMNSRAYTLAYKQVELINNSIANAEQVILSKFPEREHDEYSMFQNLNTMIGAQHSMNVAVYPSQMSKVRSQLPSILRLLANSCDLLVRLKKDGMSDEDTNILFNVLRYNLDKEIWKLIGNLNYHKKKNSEMYDRYKGMYAESLERINRFNEIYYQIKKDTDEIDEK